MLPSQGQCSIDELSHYYRLDRRIKGGDILRFVRQDISSKRIICFFYEKTIRGFSSRA